MSGQLGKRAFSTRFLLVHDLWTRQASKVEEPGSKDRICRIRMARYERYRSAKDCNLTGKLRIGSVLLGNQLADAITPLERRNIRLRRRLALAGYSGVTPELQKGVRYVGASVAVPHVGPTA